MPGRKKSNLFFFRKKLFLPFITLLVRLEFPQLNSRGQRWLKKVLLNVRFHQFWTLNPRLWGWGGGDAF